MKRRVRESQTPPPIAGRTASFQESVIREMTRLGDEAGAVNLSQGLPDFTPPAEVLEAAVQAIRSGDNQYTFPFGTATFRSAIAAKTARVNAISANPETEVTVTCGVSEAMMSAILALTDAGDEVVIFEPWYENYVPDCLMAGVRPRFVPLAPPGYRIEADVLRRAVGPHTRLVILNTPHNPTGRVFSRRELEAVAEACRTHNLVAVTDEIYEHIVYDGVEHISLGSLDGMRERTVTISGLGKTYAVTGWRVGWIVAPEPLSAQIRKVHDYLTICAPAPFQAAGIAALGLPETYYQEMRREYAARRDILLPALTRAGFRFRWPEGAYYVMADFSRFRGEGYRDPGGTVSPDRAFAEHLAVEIGVAVVPGSSFYVDGAQGARYVRFNFAKEAVTLREAVSRLARLRADGEAG
ncbi:MAG: hypothetical protein A2V88_07655 [Elusimicrobia bacterium RBG_16_66_12]|nr:MAG: hypothetical protein A2V88_07655 [Elusimicrobia bacterium RBG_16_66_12]